MFLKERVCLSWPFQKLDSQGTRCGPKGIISSSGSKMSDQRIIIEQENVVIVAWADDQEDWVVRFDKHPGVLALHWAERMVELYNRCESQRKLPA